MLRAECAGEEGACREFTHGHGTDEGCIRGRESTKEMRSICEWNADGTRRFMQEAWNADGTRQKTFHNSGGDALRGDTRSHPEHDG